MNPPVPTHPISVLCPISQKPFVKPIPRHPRPPPPPKRDVDRLCPPPPPPKRDDRPLVVSREQVDYLEHSTRRRPISVISGKIETLERDSKCRKRMFEDSIKSAPWKVIQPQKTMVDFSQGQSSKLIFDDGEAIVKAPRRKTAQSRRPVPVMNCSEECGKLQWKILERVMPGKAEEVLDFLELMRTSTQWSQLRQASLRFANSAVSVDSACGNSGAQTPRRPSSCPCGCSSPSGQCQRPRRPSNCPCACS